MFRPDMSLRTSIKYLAFRGRSIELASRRWPSTYPCSCCSIRIRLDHLRQSLLAHAHCPSDGDRDVGEFGRALDNDNSVGRAVVFPKSHGIILDVTPLGADTI